MSFWRVWGFVQVNVLLLSNVYWRLQYVRKKVHISSPFTSSKFAKLWVVFLSSFWKITNFLLLSFLRFGLHLSLVTFLTINVCFCFSSFSPLSHITLRFRFIVLSRLSFLHFSSNNFYFIPILTSVTKHVQTDLQLTPNCCPVLFSQFLENSSSIIEIAAIRHISHNRPKSDLTFRYVRIGGAK